MKWSVKNVKVLFESILAERDLRYTQMFKSSETAVSAALAAQEKAVSSAFEASEKAIVKAELAQTAYNERSNEFRAALDDQAKLQLPRIEAEGRFKELRNLVDSQGFLITELQKSDSRGEGGSKVAADSKARQQWIIALIITVAISVFGGIGTLIFFLATR